MWIYFAAVLCQKYIDYSDNNYQRVIDARLPPYRLLQIHQNSSTDDSGETLNLICVTRTRRRRTFTFVKFCGHAHRVLVVKYIHHTRLLLEVSGNKRWLTLRLLLQYLCKVFIFGLLYTIHFCFTHFRSTAIVFLLLLFVCFLKMMLLLSLPPPFLPENKYKIKRQISDQSISE